jgi:O-antigen/teichoic acid export membrane protein
MSFKIGFIKNVAKFGGYTYLVQILEFASTIILSRIISPQEYGFVALITVFSGFVFVFTQVGINHAIIRSDFNDEKIREFFSLSLWIGMVLFVIFSLMTYPISIFYNNPKLIAPSLVMGLMFLTQCLNFVPSALASKHLKFDIIGTASIIQAVIQIVFMILLAFLGFSYWSLIIPMALSPLSKYIYFRGKVKFQPSFYSFHLAIKLIKEIKTLAGSITFSGILNYWNRNADNLVIGKVYGETSLGLYNRAYRFIYLVNRLIVGIFGVVLYPSLKKLKDAGGDTNKEFLSIIGAISFMTFPVAFILILLNNQLVILLWGNDWIGVAEYMPYIGVLILIQPIFSAIDNYYVLQGKEKTVLKLSFIGAVVSISAILLGAFFSPLHIVLFYAISNIVMIIPRLIMGFYYALNYKVSEILNFWGFKVILSSMLLYTIFYEKSNLTLIIIVIYPVHLIFVQKNDLMKVFMHIKNQLMNAHKKTL